MKTFLFELYISHTALQHWSMYCIPVLFYLVGQSNAANESGSFVTRFRRESYLHTGLEEVERGSTGVGGSVAEVLLGEQQQGLAVHLEGSAGDGPQGELLLRPAQPLGHVLPAPEHRLQAWRHRAGGWDHTTQTPNLDKYICLTSSPNMSPYLI